MNQKDANSIINAGVTFGDIQRMLAEATALDDVVLNEKSEVNVGFTRKQTWKIFHDAYKKRDPDEVVTGFDEIGVRNALREFGDLLWKGSEDED